MKIGFIGLGLMGSRMAKNLLKAGNQLIVFNRTLEKAKELEELGAVVAASPFEIGENAEVVITMLSEPQIVEEVSFGENGFLNKMNPGTLWIDCSTVNPSFSKESFTKAKQKGVRFLDAPVSGTILPAEKGELTFFIGGDESDVEVCRPLFESMGKKIIHMGENGKGTSMKMVNNLLLAQAMVSFSEGMVLGEALGIPGDKLLELLPGSPAVAPFITSKKIKIGSNNFEAEFPLKWMFKDCRLAAKTGYENDLALILTNTVKELYHHADKMGFGELDFSAIYKFLTEEGKY